MHPEYKTTTKKSKTTKHQNLYCKWWNL